MKILIAIMLMVITSEGSAHSFNLGFVAPLSGPRADTGQQALDGFMLATTEQDAHLFEESDGHLGGLDSYVIKIDSSVDDKTTIERIEKLLENKQPLFVVGNLSPGFTSHISDLVNNSQAVLVNPVDSVMWQQIVGAPEKLTTMSAEPFNPKFEAAYGYQPNANVRKGYIAARLIAATVISLPESSLEDRDELMRALNRYLKE
jgi:ABC-type branched-subunit amino acid transport system substrate-binding protein